MRCWPSSRRFTGTQDGRQGRAPRGLVARRSGWRRNVIEGSKEGLIDDLVRRWRPQSPLDIINGPLMDGMNEVGPAVQQQRADCRRSTAERRSDEGGRRVSGTAYGEDRIGARKGRLLLATVKGDVHDIGKNLVEIILATTAIEVVNLGIKVPPEQLIAGVSRASAGS